jgi:probable rRNA maturation factor
MTPEKLVAKRLQPAVVIAMPCREWLSAVPAVRRVCRRAAIAALAAAETSLAESELSIMLTDDATIADLNRRYRGRDAPTDVLSFSNPDLQPGTPPSAGAAPALLGDVVVAFETASADAAKDGKSLSDHLAHLVVHGVLHLLGYDHEDDGDARSMEALEVAVLAGLGIENPYSTEQPGRSGGG